MGVGVLAADVPEQAVRRIGLELDADLFVDVRTSVVVRQTL